MVTNLEPQAGTPGNEEFRIFLQIENTVLLERMRGSITFSQKSYDYSTCT